MIVKNGISNLPAFPKISIKFIIFPRCCRITMYIPFRTKFTPFYRQKTNHHHHHHHHHHFVIATRSPPKRGQESSVTPSRNNLLGKPKVLLLFGAARRCSIHPVSTQGTQLPVLVEKPWGWGLEIG